MVAPVEKLSPMVSEAVREVENLTALYRSYEERVSVIPTSQDKSFESLVTFDNCKTEPIHRWYTFKEG